MTVGRTKGALRQERYRRHRRGDHGACLPGHCDHVPVPPPAEPLVDEFELDAANEAAEDSDEQPGSESDAPPEPFGKSGQALWTGTLKFGALTAPQRVLLREMCRMADRADVLNDMIEENRDDPGTVKWLMREARQGAIAMKGLASELRHGGAAGGSGAADPNDDRDPPADNPAAVTGEGGPGIADITARIAERLGQAAG